MTSRLLEYEVWTRLHARGLAGPHGEAARLLLGRSAFLELDRSVLGRAVEPFPEPVRTLDALHLASADFLRRQGMEVRIASYDDRFLGLARKLGFPIATLLRPDGTTRADPPNPRRTTGGASYGAQEQSSDVLGISAVTLECVDKELPRW